MIAYKGFTPDLWSRLGDGKKENCQFEIGETKRVEEAKTVRSGFHCCENPFECLTYYDFDGKNRFFRVMAAGDIDEDSMERIACTEITLLKELSPLEFALAGMQYIVEHPLRSTWKSGKHRCKVAKDEAEAGGENYIAIARGKDPRVRGKAGSILGLLKEGDTEEIIAAKLFVCKPSQAGKWFGVDEGRRVVEK